MNRKVQFRQERPVQREVERTHAELVDKKMYDLRTKQNLTLPQIAARFGLSATRVRNRLAEYERTHKKATS